MSAATTAPDWQAFLERNSVRELDARSRTRALLDDGTMRELCGPFDRLESPWLLPQGVVPESDDGVVVARGAIAGQPAVVAAIEQGFQGGGIGEVSGAKISHALRLAAADGRNGTPTSAVLLLETGGVRLQEANLGLAAVAEICSAVIELRPLAPVIGVIAGDVGCFGGVSIAAGLCTELIMTGEGRLGLNGPAVIEQEAGRDEFDASDRRLMWAIDGGEQRRATGLADRLVADDTGAVRQAVIDAIAAGPASAGTHRSERVDVLASRLASIDPRRLVEPADLRTLWGDNYIPVIATAGEAGAPGPIGEAPSRGRIWLKALAGADEPTAVIPSLMRAGRDDTVFIAVVPDPASPYHRARAGEVGLAECLALAQTLDQIVADDSARGRRRLIVAVVDLPSQAYGRLEETAGLHQAIATTVDAYVRARNAGHPVVAVVVGTALSGGFLTHGLQAASVIALDAPGVEIHAMHKPAAARITLRTVEELDELAMRVPPLSYDIRTWATLGLCDALIPVDDPDDPTPADIEAVRRAVEQQTPVARVRTDLDYRLDTPGAQATRAASRRVRDEMTRQWMTS
jgi:malonate decarboxylase beta subunit